MNNVKIIENTSQAKAEYGYMWGGVQIHSI